MLTCIPKNFCTWDYRVLGASAGSAVLAFNFFTEQGSISLGSTEFTVRKHGAFSGNWSLEHNGQTEADAQKPSALFRSFDIRIQDITLTLKAQSAFTRSYDIFLGQQSVGVIRPAHAFTRRAFIECNSDIPELAQLFSFWLVAITWRRAANNNAAHTTLP